MSLVALAAVAGPALGSSYVMMTDADLADRADLIAHVKVLAGETGVGNYTDFTVRVVEPIKGLAAGDELRVRQLGGTDVSGMSLRIYGQQRLRVDAEVLLFLADKGAYARPTDPLLGVFRVEDFGDRRVAYRGLGTADEIILEAASSEERRRELERAHLPRDLEAFSSWLRDRARGRERASDYFIDEGTGGLDRLVDGFTTLGDGDPIRWEQFDSGQDVEWIVHRRRLQGRIPSRGVGQAEDALDAWSRIGAIRYVLTGRGEADGGLTNFDGVNAVAFNDPNDEIEGEFSCNSGGTLAFAGPWFGSRTHTVDGKRFVTTAGADVVFQDGLECFFRGHDGRQSAGLTAAEIMAHELGHTLGLGHSCGDPSSPSCSGSPRLDDALMRAFVHADDRGAEITRDDRRAALSNRGMRYPRR